MRWPGSRTSRCGRCTTTTRSGFCSLRVAGGGFDPADCEDEARERWGKTEAYAESARCVQGYTHDDWVCIKAESGEVYAALVAQLSAGTPPDAPVTMDLAERHRLHIDRWFYPRSQQMHEGLASLYEADERFAATFERAAAGLTGYLVAAIRANSGRHH